MLLAIKKSSLGFLLVLAGCTGIPDGIEPVDDFQLDRYLGTWYEIARLDHRFERGLSEVTAQYSMREDGGVRVLNRGYRSAEGKWEEAEGKAYFIEGSEVGRLKVSFFGPFYGAYNIFELDEDYEYALVAGPNRSYLWVLARRPRLDPGTLEALKAAADAAGYDPSALIMVEHDRKPVPESPP